jgi:hypothetical protein
MIVRALLPWGINLWNRNRGDLKFVNGLFNPVYRNRLQFEKPLKTGRLGLIAYAYAEAFYDTRYGKFKITDIQPEWSGCWPVSWLSKLFRPAARHDVFAGIRQRTGSRCRSICVKRRSDAHARRI